MSTLGTFAKYSDFAGETGKKRGRPKKEAATYVVDTSKPQSGMVEMKPAPKAVTPAAKPVSQMQYPEGANLPYKSKQRAKGSKLQKLKGIKNRNLMIGAGLGLAGLGTAGAIAYNNRNSNKRSEMSSGSAFANFVSKDKKDAVKAMTQTGNADADAVIKKVRDESRKNRRKELANLKTQRGFESAADRGEAFKNAKGGDMVARTLATAGSPERALIAQGKKSKNGFIKGLAEGAEKVGSAGYKQGATGLRKAGNAIAGRTLIGKGVRLGAAGLGLSAIGGAMKRKRQENQ